MEGNIRVLVVDDHTLYRKGLVMLVQSFAGIGEVWDAENGQLAIDFMKNQPVDVVLLDIDMPVLDGRATARIIVNRFPDTKVIMVSMHESLNVVTEFIELGVHSYLIKDSKPEEVNKAIRYVLRNDFYYSQIVSNALKQHSEANAEKADVTKREAEILRLICEELTMKEIGQQLYVSEQTIHTHRKNLMKKTQAKNTVGLVKYALQHRIVSF